MATVHFLYDVHGRHNDEIDDMLRVSCATFHPLRGSRDIENARSGKAWEPEGYPEIPRKKKIYFFGVIFRHF